jgi:hypothetical protein
MNRSWLNSVRIFSSEWLACALLFIFVLLIFWFSPLRVMADSHYSMLVSQSLIKHGSFALDGYKVPRLYEWVTEDHIVDGNVYQLEWIDGRIYYFFPPGSSVLSTPFVALMNAFGISASNPDGTYSPEGELEIESSLASILMAALAVIFFLKSRLVLPTGWSLIIAAGGALGTQVWSTASRVLWNDTWAILLLGIVVLMLFAHETGRHRLNPLLLASLLSWMYFVRPTNAIQIICLTVYLFIFHRRLFLPYLITGALWLAGFIIYSWSNFGQWRPNYYRTSRLKFDQFWTAMAGNLLSPSRGLLIYVPVLFFVIYLLVRYRRQLGYPRLVMLALAIFVGHLVISSGFYPWHGGGCFGPRYMTGLVPWLVLLAILGVKAMLSWRETQGAKWSTLKWRTQLVAGSLLLALSIFIHARGAVSHETWRWNAWPVTIDEQPGRVWDWRQPQFLAGLVRPPLDQGYPHLEQTGRIDFTRPESSKYLWYGWSGPEQEYRWSDGREAAIVFALDEVSELTLAMRLGPFLAGGRVAEQKLGLKLNGRSLGELSLRQEAIKEYRVLLPKDALRERNVLTLKLPNAISPSALKGGYDQRFLGIRVEWMEFRPSPVTGT